MFKISEYFGHSFHCSFPAYLVDVMLEINGNKTAERKQEHYNQINIQNFYIAAIERPAKPNLLSMVSK